MTPGVYFSSVIRHFCGTGYPDTAADRFTTTTMLSIPSIVGFHDSKRCQLFVSLRVRHVGDSHRSVISQDISFRASRDNTVRSRGQARQQLCIGGVGEWIVTSLHVISGI